MSLDPQLDCRVDGYIVEVVVHIVDIKPDFTSGILRLDDVSISRSVGSLSVVPT
jgi:hypothetical protein